MKKLAVLCGLLLLSSGAQAIDKDHLAKATDLDGDNYWGCEEYTSNESRCELRGRSGNLYLFTNWDGGTACPDNLVFVYNEDTNRYMTMDKIIDCGNKLEGEFDYTLARDKSGNAIVTKLLKGRIISTQKVSI
ncbi:hypothetical protein [Providencia alcalifaciens]|uniref:hypothetical protein n=1 Tax=Providencia alcalifaciens TaxID=126385 RepID=UPI003D95BD4B